MLKKQFYIGLFVLAAILGKGYAVETIGVVNFQSCISDSKYGQNEQKQLEDIKSQWSSLITDTEKELKDLSKKMQDQEYMDGLSPEAERELKIKFSTLNEDMSKYQNQLYQVLNQANYFSMQKMLSNISKASEIIAKQEKLSFVMNKDAVFYVKPDLDLTKQVIAEMDKDYAIEQKNNAKNEEAKKQETKKEVAKEEKKEDAKTSKAN
jgi:outer membrane protein